MSFVIRHCIHPLAGHVKPSQIEEAVGEGLGLSDDDSDDEEAVADFLIAVFDKQSKVSRLSRARERFESFLNELHAWLDPLAAAIAEHGQFGDVSSSVSFILLVVCSNNIRSLCLSWLTVE